MFAKPWLLAIWHRTRDSNSAHAGQSRANPTWAIRQTVSASHTLFAKATARFVLPG